MNNSKKKDFSVKNGFLNLQFCLRPVVKLKHKLRWRTFFFKIWFNFRNKKKTNLLLKITTISEKKIKVQFMIFAYNHIQKNKTTIIKTKNSEAISIRGGWLLNFLNGTKFTFLGNFTICFEVLANSFFFKKLLLHLK